MGAPHKNQKQLPLGPAGFETVQALLLWYGSERRHLPWRYGPRKKADPYRVWLSEIMLQQTTVKAVIPYFQKFVARWPTVAALASAQLEEVLQQWAGLGYYSRARNLKACADAVVRDFDGVFPSTEIELLELPGIGPYTAAAIAAIAFGEKATPVDGNIERVVSRLFAVQQPLPASKSEIRRLAATLTPARRAGDFAQAMMDLGAEICTPKNPSCLVCPVQQDCAANARGLAQLLPIKAQRMARPSRYGVAFLVQREDGAVLLRQRPGRDCLAVCWKCPPRTGATRRRRRRKQCVPRR
jgi:A/G-specific adenine glycosylase